MPPSCFSIYYTATPLISSNKVYVFTTRLYYAHGESVLECDLEKAKIIDEDNQGLCDIEVNVPGIFVTKDGNALVRVAVEKAVRRCFR